MATLADRLGRIIGNDLPVGIRCYDGSRLGPPDPPATASFGHRTRFGESWRHLASWASRGLRRGRHRHRRRRVRGARAARALRRREASLRDIATVVRIAGPLLVRPLPPPPEEARSAGTAPLAGTGCGRDRASLRPFERLLPHAPRALDDLLVRGVVQQRRRRSKTRSGRSTSWSASSSGLLPVSVCSTSDRVGVPW